MKQLVWLSSHPEGPSGTGECASLRRGLRGVCGQWPSCWVLPGLTSGDGQGGAGARVGVWGWTVSRAGTRVAASVPLCVVCRPLVQETGKLQHSGPPG